MTRHALFGIFVLVFPLQGCGDDEKSDGKGGATINCHYMSAGQPFACMEVTEDTQREAEDYCTENLGMIGDACSTENVIGECDAHGIHVYYYSPAQTPAGAEDACTGSGGTYTPRT